MSLPLPPNNTNNTDNTVAVPDSSRVLWSDFHIRTLIDERRRRNFEYWYQIPGRSRNAFWHSVADHVNRVCNTNYTSTQCKNKFASLVHDYNVSNY